MRYFRFSWLGTVPSDKEVFEHLLRIFGVQGVVVSGLRVKEGMVSCENSWGDKVRGALALKWQFLSRVSGTKKSLESVDI